MSITKIKKLRIFLCDLTYDSIILVSDTIPINIGFVGSYLLKEHGDKIDINLFYLHVLSVSMNMEIK